MTKYRKKPNPALVLKWAVAIVLIVVIGVVAVALAAGLNPSDSEPLSPPQVAGIDVSSHQGTIDWVQVADSGVEFAMIRLGYRGYDTGTLHIDQRAVENLVGARAAGVKIGAYFFSQALTPEEARQEAQLALSVLDGMKLDLPLAFDWEFVAESARTGNMTRQALTECVHAFCQTVEQAGYGPMIYFNRELSRTLLDMTQVGRYPIWFAQYTKELDFNSVVTMWQHSDQGRIPGIDENVDLNWYFGEFSE